MMIKSNISMPVNYIEGDATLPAGDVNKVIVHICNDIGKWGRGFVLAISKRWPEPEQEYRRAFMGGKSLGLGDVQFISVSDNITVANLVGQHGIKRKYSTGEPPVRYDAIRNGLERVSAYSKEHNASVHMPRIGCGLAGGTWEMIEPIILETLVSNNVSSIVYDY